jgi:hypothetical protein
MRRSGFNGPEDQGGDQEKSQSGAMIWQIDAD